MQRWLVSLVATVGLFSPIGWYFFLRGKDVVFEPVNLMPFPVTVWMGFPEGDGRWKVTAATIAPGDSARFDWHYPRSADTVYEVAFSASGDVVNELYGKPLKTSGETLRSVEGNTISFQRASTTEERVPLLLPAPDPVNSELMLAPWPGSLEEAQRNARELAALLPRRLAFAREWANRPMPYLPGAAFIDENTSFGPGIIVRAAASRTPLDGVISLQPKDDLREIGGFVVYGPSDTYRAIMHHVQTKTAAEPIVTKVIRDGKWVEEKTAVYFNDAFFIPNPDEWLKAGVSAAARTATLGTGIDTWLFCKLQGYNVPEFDHERCRIDQTNQRLLLVQQHRDADLVGSFAGLPVPILRVPFRRLLPGTAAGRATAVILAETVEASLLAANESAAGVNRLDRALSAAPWGAGFGVISLAIR